MKRALLAVAAAIALNAQAANPIVNGWYADPEIRIYGDATSWAASAWPSASGPTARSGMPWASR